MWYKDILGKRFSKLTVQKVATVSDRQMFNRTKNSYYTRKDIYYLCLCDCGNIKNIFRTNLTSGHTKSCGCLKRKTKDQNPAWTGYKEIGGAEWSRIVNHAKKRKLKFEITIEQAYGLFETQEGRCSLTGLPLTFNEIKDGKHVSGTASLDRIDNTKGYLMNNIQWLHKDINWMKGTYSQERFIELCHLVSRNVS